MTQTKAHLSVQHILELDAKLIVQGSRILATVMNDLGHTPTLQDGLEVPQDIFIGLKHVKQVTCVIVKNLQADLTIQDRQCRLLHIPILANTASQH